MATKRGIKCFRVDYLDTDEDGCENDGVTFIVITTSIKKAMGKIREECCKYGYSPHGKKFDISELNKKRLDIANMEDDNGYIPEILIV